MFFEIRTRPAPVPAHIVSGSLARDSALRLLPPFVVPNGEVAVLFVSVTLPSGGQSAAEPHGPVKITGLGTTATLQFSSRNARSPPAFCVRQIRWAPTKIVFETSGSEMTGA